MVAKGQFGVNRICQLTGISKATYYAAQNPVDRFKHKYLNIKSFIELIIQDNSSYGIKRIKAELKDRYQISIGRDSLA